LLACVYARPLACHTHALGPTPAHATCGYNPWRRAVTYGMLILAEGRKKEYASKFIERIVHNHITMRLPLKLP
jgi:hypothetical protein